MICGSSSDRISRLGELTVTYFMSGSCQVNPLPVTLFLITFGPDWLHCVASLAVYVTVDMVMVVDLNLRRPSCWGFISFLLHLAVCFRFFGVSEGVS